MRIKSTLVIGFFFLIIGISLLYLIIPSKAPSFLFCNTIVLTLMTIVGYLYGPLSSPSIVTVATFAPSLAFLWSWAHNAPYISFHNQWLQNNPMLVNYAAYISMVGLILTISMFLLFNNFLVKQPKIFNNSYSFGTPIYFISIILCAFFFWLTEPSLNTIISSTYLQIVEERIKGSQFAGAFTLIFWLISFTCFSARTTIHPQSGTLKLYLIDYLFIIVTFAGTLWLILHARRSELIGIFLILLIAIKERKGIISLVLLAIVFFVVLIGIEIVRASSLKYFMLENNFSASTQSEVASMPGGMSNIYMTFLDTLDYFSRYPFFAGDTFINYFYQILPSNFYSFLEISHPEYFYQQVFINNLYSYNGGTHILSPFYGNFGLSGLVLAALFLSLYAVFINKFLTFDNLAIRMIGLFMIAIIFRAFWYELITLFKPIFIIYIPIIILLNMIPVGFNSFKK